MSRCDQINGGDHARPQMTGAIVYGDFNGKGSVTCIGSRRDTCNPAVERTDAALRLNPDFLTQTNPWENVVGDPKSDFHSTYIRQGEGSRRRRYQGAKLDLPAQNVSSERSL